jgi:hypothetical protein
MASIVQIAVHVRNATAQGLRSVRNSINGMNRGILRGLGDIFQDGIGQALARGFNAAASNPYVAAAVVALVAALVAQLGAALAGALTLAFGGAFIALGVMAAKGADEVKRNWTAELKDLKARFKEAAEPLIPVLHRAAHVMGDLGRKFAPAFGRAMEEAAPFLDRFLSEMSRGIEKFGRRAFFPMMDAFNGLLEAMDWEGFLSDLGDSFGHLGDVVLRNKEAVASVLDTLLGLLPKTINLIASLTEAWGKAKPWFDTITSIIATGLAPAFEVLGVALNVAKDIQTAMIGPLQLLHRGMVAFHDEALVPLGDFIKGTFGPIWSGLVQGFEQGWQALQVGLVPVLRDLWQVAKDTAREMFSIIPGLEGLRDRSQDAGKILKEWIIDKMTALSDWLAEHREDIKEWAQKLGEAAVGVALALGILIGLLITAFTWVHENWDLIMTVTGINALITLIGWLMTAWGWVSRHWGLVMNVYGVNFIQDVINWLQIAWGWIKRNWSTVVTFYAPGLQSVIGAVQTLWSWVSRSWSRNVNFNFSMSGAYNSIKSMLGFAHGGVVGTAATGGIRSNMTLVGENGPELVDLAPGSHVRSNSDSRRLVGQGGGGGGPITIQLVMDGQRLAEVLFDPLRNQVFSRGGNVQAALGRGTA